MKMLLSCFKCGSVNFKRTEQPCTNIEDRSYLLASNYKDAVAVCEECGLEDYVENLVVVYH